MIFAKKYEGVIEEIIIFPEGGDTREEGRKEDRVELNLEFIKHASCLSIFLLYKSKIWVISRTVSIFT